MFDNDEFVRKAFTHGRKIVRSYKIGDDFLGSIPTAKELGYLEGTCEYIAFTGGYHYEITAGGYVFFSENGSNKLVKIEKGGIA